ncbi:MAG: hypothetical protein Q4C25_00530 [Bacillota bacterium]|nr:hypothetical protein [Bacillota bacterium]
MMTDSRKTEKKQGRSYLGTGITSILIALIILMLACFAALTYVSAGSQMKLSEKSEAYCSSYYDAETTACEVISWIFAEKIKIIEDKSEEITYNNDTSSDIVIYNAGDSFTFDVPVNKRQQLSVEVDVSGTSAEILKWQVTSL